MILKIVNWSVLYNSKTKMINVKRTFASEFFAFGALEMALEKKFLAGGSSQHIFFQRPFQITFYLSWAFSSLWWLAQVTVRTENSGNQNDQKSGRPSVYYSWIHFQIFLILKYSAGRYMNSNTHLKRWNASTRTW